MTAQDIKTKYTGIQTRFKKEAAALSNMGNYGCLFLSLCSIAEEYNGSKQNGRQLDIAAFYLDCKARGYIDGEFYCKNQPGILELATGAKWEKAEMKKLPVPLPDEMYTVERWRNPKTGGTHFKRRGFDTLINSVTVATGRFETYYVYTHK